MCYVSPRLPLTDKIVIDAERRLQAEWDLLQQLAQLNPGRLTDISSEDRAFKFLLQDTPVRLASSPGGEVISTHNIRVIYPAFFPSTPLEFYVGRAFLHPNVHPETGFVCLWTQHHVDYTLEHALHKLVAMMSGHLYNLEAMHVMQPEALNAIRHGSSEYKQLIGITHDRFILERTRRRIRLS